MTAADATEFFLARGDRAENRTTAALDVLAVGGALGLHAPTIFAPVHELKARGWIAVAGADCALARVAGTRMAGRRRTRKAGEGGARSSMWPPSPVPR